MAYSCRIREVKFTVKPAAHGGIGAAITNDYCKCSKLYKYSLNCPCSRPRCGVLALANPYLYWYYVERVRRVQLQGAVMPARYCTSTPLSTFTYRQE